MGSLIERPVRDALRMIAPGPVTLISSFLGGQPNVMAGAWLRAQSLNPTLIGLAIHPDRLTHQFVNSSEQVVINIPVYSMMAAVHRAGEISGRDGDKFAALDLEPTDARVIDTPRVAGCAGYIECLVRDRTTAGDHDLFLLDVVAVDADDESFDGFWNLESEAGQLLHHLGANRYAGLSRPYQITFDEEADD